MNNVPIMLSNFPKPMGLRELGNQLAEISAELNCIAYYLTEKKCHDQVEAINEAKDTIRRIGSTIAMYIVIRADAADQFRKELITASLHIKLVGKTLTDGTESQWAATFLLRKAVDLLAFNGMIRKFTTD